MSMAHFYSGTRYKHRKLLIYFRNGTIKFDFCYCIAYHNIHINVRLKKKSPVGVRIVQT